MEEAREEKTDSPLKQIRTFQGDVAEALNKQEESLVSIQQREYEKRGFEPPIEGGRRNLLLLSLGSLTLIVLGFLGAWYGYGEYIRKTAPPVISAPANRFLSPTSEVNLSVSTSTSREALLSAFDSAVLGLSSGELKHVVLRKGRGDEAALLETAELLNILESRAPGSLVRSFEPLFMLGASGESRFLIIKLSSFENAFPGMLSWEGDVAQDLGPLLLSPQSLKAIAPASVFRDIIIKNKDVRVLEAASTSSPQASSTPVLLYSFFDNNMLVITDTLSALETLLDRLTRAKLSR